MKQEQLTKITDRINEDDKFLMYIVGLLLEYEQKRHKGEFVSPNLKPLWKGHVQFMNSVTAWWQNKGYISHKQRDVLIKQVTKYIDRVSIIYDYLDNSVDTGSEVPIFSGNDLDGKCPSCGSRDFKQDVTSVELIYKCGHCGFKAKYNLEPEDYSDELQKEIDDVKKQALSGAAKNIKGEAEQIYKLYSDTLGSTFTISTESNKEIIDLIRQWALKENINTEDDDNVKNK